MIIPESGRKNDGWIERKIVAEETKIFINFSDHEDHQFLGLKQWH